MTMSLFIDSGCDADLMNSSLVRTLGLRAYRLPHPTEVNAVDGKPLGDIYHCTQSVMLTFLDSHPESLSFHVLDIMGQIN